MFSSPGAENSSSQMNIRTGNVYDTLSEESDVKDSVASSTYQSDHPYIGDMSVNASSSITQKAQLQAEFDRMQEEYELLTMQRRNDAMRAQLAAVKKPVPIIPLSDSQPLYQSTPATALHVPTMHPSIIHQPAPPVNRQLYSSGLYAQSLTTPVSNMAQARRDAIAALPLAVPAMNTTASAPALVPVRSTSPVRIKHLPPAKFSGEKAAQNARIETWISEAKIYLQANHIAPKDHLFEISTLFCDYALEWLAMKEEEVALQKRAMTWEWLQIRMIEEFGRSRGRLAERAEWMALKMGNKGTDGTDTGDKATRTVQQYTSLFTRLMRALTTQTRNTEDIVIIDRYCEGIKNGWPALWSEMKGTHAVLVYVTLADAIEGAEIAETQLGVRSKESSHHHHGRHHTHHVNHIHSNTSMDDSPSPPRSPVNRRRQRKPSTTLTANGFVYRPVGAEEGRYRLSESEMKALYEQNRCYHCYQPRHPKMNSCPKKMTVPPPPLN
jgi:hypothetical protein